jgi:hypothetical protein
MQRAKKETRNQHLQVMDTIWQHRVTQSVTLGGKMCSL